MKNVWGVIAGIAVAIFVCMKWGGLILGILGVLGAGFIYSIFVGGGDQ